MAEKNWQDVIPLLPLQQNSEAEKILLKNMSKSSGEHTIAFAMPRMERYRKGFREQAGLNQSSIIGNYVNQPGHTDFILGRNQFKHESSDNNYTAWFVLPEPVVIPKGEAFLAVDSLTLNALEAFGAPLSSDYNFVYSADAPARSIFPKTTWYLRKILHKDMFTSLSGDAEVRVAAVQFLQECLNLGDCDGKQLQSLFREHELFFPYSLRFLGRILGQKMTTPGNVVKAEKHAAEWELDITSWTQKVQIRQ